MTLPRIWSRAIAMSFGLAMLAGIGTPARAADPYPGETREAFAAREAMEQQGKQAGDNPIAAALVPELADADSSNPLNSGLAYGLFGLVTVAFGAMRLSRGIFRASQAVTRTGGLGRKSKSFEDRLAEKLRELEPSSAPPMPEAPPQAPLTPMPAPLPLPLPLTDAPILAPTVARPAAGPRTFGRRPS